MAIGTTAAILASTAISAGTSLMSGSKQVSAAKQSANAVQQASDQSAATQRYIFDTARADNATRQQAGDAATRQMAALMGLNLAPAAAPTNTPANALVSPMTAAGAPPAGAGDNRLNAIAARYGMADDPRFIPQEVGATSSASIGTGQYGAAQSVPENALAPAAGAATAGQSPTDWLRSTPGYDFNFKEGMRSLNTGLAGQGRLQSGDAQREAVRYGQNYGDRIYGEQYNRLAGLAGAGQTASGQNQQAGQSYANALTNINQSNAQSKASSYQNGANAWTNALGGAAGAGMWAMGQMGGGYRPGGGSAVQPGGAMWGLY